jgi:hypothetical protein
MSSSALNITLPIYNEDKSLSFKKVADFMGINETHIPKIAPISKSALSRNLTQNTIKKMQPLLHLLNLLWALSEGDKAQVRQWLNHPRVEWRGLTPIDLLEHGKIDQIISFLDGLLEGEVMGA